MKICLVTPAPAYSRKGNRVTALRWQKILCGLGNKVTVSQKYERGDFDLLIAIHAFRSHSSVRDFTCKFPGRPVVVALAGTDIYDKIHTEPKTIECLEDATVIVALQHMAIKELPARLRKKAVVIHQSALAGNQKVMPLKNSFEVSLLCHLREVKGPFLAARAARLLPDSSLIRITHVGEALSASMKKQAIKEAADNPRYRWLGEVSPGNARRLLKRSRLLVVSSKLEGGANVVSEALVCSVPVLSTRISGSIGMLGEDYAGYFPVGNHRALYKLLTRAESDGSFYRMLKKQCAARALLFRPEEEKKSWKGLLGKLFSNRR